MTEGRAKEQNRDIRVPETIPALFLLSGILCAFRDMMYAPFCLAAASAAGVITILVLQISEMFPRVSGIARRGIYGAGIMCFLGFILYIAQGFLDTINRFMILWNLRFSTEFKQFSVDGRAAAGALIFWCLLSVLLGAFVLVLVKKRYIGSLLLLIMISLLTGFILGRSGMWLSVLFLLSGGFGSLAFSAAPYRRRGIRGRLCALFAGAVFLVLFFAAEGYEGLSQITGLRERAVAWYERFRYGEDTLPKGDTGKAGGLLQGERETLILETEKLQELYLKGFVGGTYDGRMWKELGPEAYQGEYEGLLEWLETKNFSAVTQFAGYDRLTSTSEDSYPGRVQVQVKNVGAYRKYIYLPSSAEDFAGAGAKVKKDWQVRSGRFFGAREYRFDSVDAAPSADEAVLDSWVQSPSGKEEKDYLGAEAVYSSFVQEYYTEVDEELKEEIEEMFFAEAGEMDFRGVTAQIRRVLRQQTEYARKPQGVPEGQDFVEYFLTGQRRGNAVHYASAAVMAYRTAGYAARYVEGYHLSEDEALILSEENQTAAVLTNQNAHAWAEVYFPGAGWMPVEVVPGMYTELYTDQVVEGAPAYQVNSDQTEKGLELEGGAGGEEEKEEKRERTTLTFRGVLSVILLCMYISFVLYLVLEIQRAVRLVLRRRRAGGLVQPAELYAGDLERMLLIGRVPGNYNHPMELSGEVEKRFRGISRGEYERAVTLLQKVRFGQKELLPHETHALNCFKEKLARILYCQKSAWGKAVIRYWYALY